MSRESLQAVRAVFLAAIMVTSVMAAGVAFSGSAAASEVGANDSTYPSPDPADFDYAVNGSGDLSGYDGLSNSDFDETYRTLEAAVEATDSSNTDILVFPGEYQALNGDSAPVGSDIVLASIEGPQTTTIESTDSQGIRVSGGDVIIKGFKITSQQSAGIYLTSDAANSTVKYNIINDTTADPVNATNGIRVEQRSATIQHNTIKNHEQGLVVAKDFKTSDRVLIRENEFVNNGLSGVYIVGKKSTTSGHVITGNSFTGTIEEYNTGSGVVDLGGDVLLNENGANIENISVHRNNFDETGTGISTLDSDGDGFTEPVSASNNYWGSASGPQAGTNTYNDDSQGAAVSDNVEFTPWLDASTDNGGQSFAPVTNGDEQFASIQAAVNVASSGDVIEAKSGVYDESVTIDTANVTIRGVTDPRPQDSDPAIIFGQSSSSDAVSINADNVTIDQLGITHPNGAEGTETTDFAGAVGVNVQSGNHDVTIQDSVIANIGTQNDDANPIGVYAEGDTDGITVERSAIVNLRGTFDDGDDDFTTADDTAGNPDEGAVQAILINSQQAQGGINGPITNAQIQGNIIGNLTDTRSTVAVRFNGEVTGEITDNRMEDLNTEGDIPGTDEPGGFTQVISLAEGGNSVTGPRDVTISRNTIANIETTTESNFAPPYGIIIGSSTDASSVSIVQNNIVLDDAPGNRTSTAVGVANGADETLDARLNWWGSDRGPGGESTNRVMGDVAYDPFLTTPADNIEGDVGDTQQFAQDVRVPTDQDIAAVGFPGPVPSGYTVGDAFSNFNGTIYELNPQNDSFEPVTDGSREISALDAFVIVQDQNETLRDDVQVVIKYRNVAEDSAGSPDIKTIEPGFNLIAPRALADSYEAFNSPTDREVIYGTYGLPAGQPAFLPTGEADPEFVESTFGPDQDDPVVTPYGGYLVFTEEQRPITTYVQSGVTADEIFNSENLNRTAA